MDVLDLVAALFALTTLLAFCNHRFLRMPFTVGVMVLALGLSLVLLLLDHALVPIGRSLESTVVAFDFRQTVMHWMLGFLLFANGMTIRIGDLLSEKWAVLGLATVGVLISGALIGVATACILPGLGLPVTLLGCLAFGALIAPTDPVAAMGIMRAAGTPKRMRTAIAGESLFNDAIAAALFIVLMGAAAGTEELTTGGALHLICMEAGGGVVVGLAMGFATLLLIRSIGQPQNTVLAALTCVMVGYAAAEHLGISGPLVAAFSGLIIGNPPRRLAYEAKVRHTLTGFWELVDHALNALLFTLLGLEMLVIHARERVPYVLVALLLVFPLLLVARATSVFVVFKLTRFSQWAHPRQLAVFTWGGLRGGVSLALAMYLPVGPERACWVAVTYTIVLLSIVGQGLTLGWVVRYAERGSSPTSAAGATGGLPSSPVPF